MRSISWLALGGALSAIAAILHLAIILGGPDWYRFFGAGEGMAQAAERGESGPAIITLIIAFILFGWSLYAFSGAGLVRRLPLLRTCLVAITAVYLARALAPVPILLLAPEQLDPFLLWSSAIVLIYGLAHAIGTWKAWPRLSRTAD
jgi:hypothetical protein